MQLPLLPSHPTCDRCPLSTLQPPGAHVGVPTRPLTPLPGNLRPLVPDSTGGVEPPAHVLIVVGMNPGHNEALKNEPFVGPSGRLLRSLLAPLPPLPVYLTNACRCSTPGFDPVDLNFRACAPYLLDDLHAISSFHPDSSLVLLALGTAAVGQCHRLASRRGPSVTAALSRQGVPLHLPPIGSLLHPGRRGLPPSLTPFLATFFCTWHPAFLLREPSAVPSSRDHIRLLCDHLLGILPTPSSPVIVPPHPPSTT